MLDSWQIKWCFAVSKNRVDNVPRVCDALIWTHNRMRAFGESEMIFLVSMITDSTSWRNYKVLDENGVQIGSDPENIRLQLSELIEGVNAGVIKADQMFWDFVAIHPLGKGYTEVVGQILWNWMMRTTGVPGTAPSYRSRT